jgi:hypothetical protein
MTATRERWPGSLAWSMLQVRTTVRVFAAGFVGSMFVVLACDNWPPPTSFRCQPSSSDRDSRCPKDEFCCSDEPAALDIFDLDGPGIPAYGTESSTGTGTGTPVFSADQNDASDFGMCIRVGSVAPAFALPNGCPIPCNPSWDRPSIDAVCGPGIFCCQTLEIEASDCVFDPELGDGGCWRPVRGDDIVGLGGLDATSWTANEHASHQDSGLHGCEAFVAGLSSTELDDAGVTEDEVRGSCLRRLGVANQRGFCIGGPGVSGCPLAQPSYRDACEQINDREIRSGCG